MTFSNWVDNETKVCSNLASVQRLIMFGFLSIKQWKLIFIFAYSLQKSSRYYLILPIFLPLDEEPIVGFEIGKKTCRC